MTGPATPKQAASILTGFLREACVCSRLGGHFARRFFGRLGRGLQKFIEDFFKGLIVPTGEGALPIGLDTLLPVE